MVKKLKVSRERELAVRELLAKTARSSEKR
jgi:hypothetical protein